MNDVDFFKHMVQTSSFLHSGLPNKIFGIKDKSSIHRFTSTGYTNVTRVTAKYFLQELK